MATYEKTEDAIQSTVCFGEEISFRINKKDVYRIIYISFIAGIIIGILLTTMINVWKIKNEREKQLEEILGNYDIIKEQKDELGIKTSLVRNLRLDLDSALKKISMLEKVLKELEVRKELYDKYEYILMYNNERTDLTYDELQFGIEEMDKRGINPHLLTGVIYLESKGRRDCANSKSTARGYGQFIAGTGKWVYEQRFKRGTYNHDMAFDGYLNIEMCAEYLGYLMDKNNGSVMNTLLDYNGRELGSVYYNIVNNIIKTSNIDLNQIENEYREGKL